MNSDDSRRLPDRAFKHPGEGLTLWPLCFYCNNRKEREGGKMRGPLKNLFSCKACEEKRAKSKHELSGA